MYTCILIGVEEGRCSYWPHLICVHRSEHSATGRLTHQLALDPLADTFSVECVLCKRMCPLYIDPRTAASVTPLATKGT